MRNILIVFLTSFLVACGTALPTIKPYKLDIQQGNVVTSKMLLQLRPGMTKSQVRYIMGTPLIQDSFHGNRWDYFYQLREGGKVIEQRRVILDFENELLKAVRGDVVASDGGSGEAAKSDQVTGARIVEPEPKVEEKGFFSKLKFWEKDEDELAKEAEEKIAAQKKAEEDAKKSVEQAKQSVPPAAPALPEVKPVADEVKDEEAKPLLVEPKALPVEDAPLDDAKKSEKGWLDKLKFWGDDASETKVESKSVEAASPEQQSVEQNKEAPKDESSEKSEKGWLDKLKFWKNDAPEVKPDAAVSEEVRSLSGVEIIEAPEKK